MTTRSPGEGARSMQDIAGGLVLIGIATLALYLVQHLPASGRVGFASGTAPRLFAYGLMGLGVWITVAGFLKEGPGVETLNWRGIVTILGAVVFFALAIRTFGLALIGIPMVMLAALATKEGTYLESLIFAAGMTAFCSLLFPTLLGQPIPLWPQFSFTDDLLLRAWMTFVAMALLVIASLTTYLAYLAHQNKGK